MGNSVRIMDLEVERLISQELLSYLKGSRQVLENVLKHYGAKERKGNWDCISARHIDARQDLSISYKNGYVCACHCGLVGDVFKVVEILEGKSSFNEQVKKVCDINSISIDQVANHKSASLGMYSISPKGNRYNLNEVVDDLHQYVNYTDYFINRGLSSGIIDKFRLGYHREGLNYIIKKYPGLFAEKVNDLNSSYQYFIPCYDSKGRCINILARRNDNLEAPTWVNFKISKIHNLKGCPAALLNIKYLNNPELTDKYIFIVESWADALSLEELGYNSIALNSTSNTNIFFKHVEKNKDHVKNKVFITAGNADTPGLNMNSTIINGLNMLDIQCYTYIVSQYKDINEFLQSNREELEISIKNFMDSLASEKKDTIDEDCRPIPFDEYDSLPNFPIDSLIGWQARYIKAVSESTQTPVDFGAVLSLSAIATAVQGKYVVEGYADWVEPLNLYTASVAKPSERKSSVYMHIVKPIFEYECLENERLKPEIEKSRTEKRILEEKKICQEKAASNSKGKDWYNAKKKAMELAEEIANFKELAPLHLIADDITPERCATLLAENNGKLSILSSEASLFEIIKGRYSNNGNANFEVFLKGYSGDEIRVDRQRQQPIYVNNPTLTIGLMVQPDVIEGLMQNTALRGRGLTARFLYSIPCSLVGRRKINPEAIPAEVKKEYYYALNTLLKSETPEQPHIIKLSQQARFEFDKFREELEPRLIGDLSFICDWAGKLAGNILRIAGLLSLAGKVKENTPFLSDKESEIPVSIMINAITIGKYFIEHAKGAFGMMGTDSNTENAKILLKWLQNQGITEFKKYRAFRALRGRVRNTEEVEPALKVLIERNYIAMETVAYEGTGRKPEAKYKRIN